MLEVQGGDDAFPMILLKLEKRVFFQLISYVCTHEFEVFLCV